MVKRVFVINCTPIICRGYATILSTEPDLELVFATSTASKALETMEEHRPDVVVLELRLPGMSGLEFIKRASSQFPHVRLLVASACDETLLGPRVFEAGAHGYVEIRQPTDVLVEAIRTVLRTGRYASANLQRFRHHSSSPMDGRGSYLHQLSDRELEVFERIGRGMTTREIADELFISIKTVQTHRGNAMEKLGSTSVTDFTRLAALAVHGIPWDREAKSDSEVPETSER